MYAEVKKVFLKHQDCMFDFYETLKHFLVVQSDTYRIYRDWFENSGE